jgi:inhibitor of cysteine peptidase
MEMAMIARMRTGLWAGMLLAVFSCASHAGGDGMFLLTEADNGKTVDLRVGEEARVRLSENASTGYQWAVESADEALAQIGEAVHFPGPADRVGGSGSVQWVLRAKAPGRRRVSFKYWRPWEGDRSIVKRFEITLRIAP